MMEIHTMHSQRCVKFIDVSQPRLKHALKHLRIETTIALRESLFLSIIIAASSDCSNLASLKFLYVKLFASENTKQRSLMEDIILETRMTMAGFARF